ncbi:uncharacterized protein LOC142417122 [Mycteria americana]|uniref:uncharacterized protein LOC142417122 n=1 Tax=Mycteria americana TaxID=33587 RepID=UPI003F5813B0
MAAAARGRCPGMDGAGALPPPPPPTFFCAFVLFRGRGSRAGRGEGRANLPPPPPASRAGDPQLPGEAGRRGRSPRRERGRGGRAHRAGRGGGRGEPRLEEHIVEGRGGPFLREEETMSRAGRLLESRENARPAARLGTARYGSTILPIAPWEQTRTLLRQQQHGSTLRPLPERWVWAGVQAAALQGSSLTARLPAELGRAPSTALAGHRAASSLGGMGMLRPGSGRAAPAVLASPGTAPAPRQGPEDGGSVTSRPAGDRRDGRQRLGTPSPAHFRSLAV